MGPSATNVRNSTGEARSAETDSTCSGADSASEASTTGAEATAVDAQNRRMRRAGGVARTHDIQGKLAADGRGILQVGLEDYVVRHGRPFGLLGGKARGQYQ